jgi:hypothetical protein
MPRRVYQAQRQGNLLWVRAAVGVNGGEPITLRLLVDTGREFYSITNSGCGRFRM